MNVADACCGTGGKSLHLASLMNNSGHVLSLDVVDIKLHDLQKRAEKAGVQIIKSKLIANNKFINNFEKKFDRVLLDVPCSGSGVLKRNPEIKWNLNEVNLSELIKTQKNILENYTKMVTVGGKAVYATCSLLAEENEKQVEDFLKSEPGNKFKLEKQIRIWPHLSGCDGFYAAVLIRET
jgi:16S rRNA (cytosine967-C5)-methyltransferase